MSGTLNTFNHYLRRVFKFHCLLFRLHDSRPQPKIPTSAGVLSLLLGAALRVPSFLQLQAETKRAAWQRQVGYAHPISDDTFAYVTERLDLSDLRAALVSTNKILKRNKAFAANKYSGLLVASLDGNEQFKSRSRCCEQCRQRSIKIKNARGQEETVIEYYHQNVFCQISGPHFSVLLDVEPVLPGEDEVAAALRLLRRLRQLYGPKFFDVLNVDAAYAEGPFLTAAKALGWSVVVVLKQERYEVWQEAQRLSADVAATQSFASSAREQVQLWEVKDLPFSETYAGKVRVVRSVETGTEIKQVGGQRQRQSYQSQWCWVASGDLDVYPPRTIWAIGHGRWKVENNAFHELTQHWHLEHCSHHHPVAIMACLLILLLAFNLFRAFAQLHGKLWRAGRVTMLELRRQLDRAMEHDALIFLFSG
jgi:hypothetical protein